MKDRLTKQLTAPAQVVYKKKATTTAPKDCGEGGVYVPKGSDG